MIRWILLGAIVACSPVQGQAEWKPGPSPLMTRWGERVRPENAWREYPRPTFVRNQWMNLNGLWQWEPGAEGAIPDPDRPLARTILVPFAPEAPLSGLGGMEHHTKECWYRRTFRVPEEWRGMRIILHFGAVDWRARVAVNGHILAVHEGGYAPFAVDITEALHAEGDQGLMVQVEDPTDEGTQPRGKQVNKPGGIFYTPTTGIWQTVWLEPLPAQRLWRPRVTAGLDGSVSVDWPPGMAEPGLIVTAAAYDGEAEVAQGEFRAEQWDVPATIALRVEGPKLWTPESPALYTLRLRLKSAGDQLLDEAETYFAFRTVGVEKDAAGVPRIMLNGEPVFCLGLLDQGFWPDGLYTAPSDEALRYDIEMTRRLGFNTIRKHVKMEPERWYYWADRLGVMVWQDMPSGDRSISAEDPDLARTPESAGVFERELGAMINHLRPHPSVVMWVPFNEGWGQFDTARITAAIKEADPTRLVNSASGWVDRRTGDVLDIHAYPGLEAPKADGARALALGEFGGLGLRVEGHSWGEKGWGYKGMKDAAELTRAYVELLARVKALRETAGLSAAIYTQTTDVETECNGLMTYDRAVLKPEEGEVRSANEGVLGAAAGGEGPPGVGGPR